MIPDRIRDALERKGMTQRQLADALDTTEVSISRYVMGNRTPKATTLKRIADICGVPVDFFFGDGKSKWTKAVIIKGMEMPKSCAECSFEHDCVCRLTGEVVSVDTYKIQNMDDCPMEETEVEE